MLPLVPAGKPENWESHCVLLLSAQGPRRADFFVLFFYGFLSSIGFKF